MVAWKSNFKKGCIKVEWNRMKYTKKTFQRKDIKKGDLEALPGRKDYFRWLIRQTEQKQTAQLTANSGRASIFCSL